jgi:periplasmic protein TonB
MPSAATPLSISSPAPRKKVARRQRWSSDEILAAALTLSLALHGLLLMVHFTFPDFKLARNGDKNLEVVLVNAHHARAPDKAEALAQANVDGGGASEHKARPSTPLPPQDQRREGDSLQEAHRRTVQAETHAQQVMTQAQSSASLHSETRREQQPAETQPRYSGYDLMDSSAAMVRMDAAIDKTLNEAAQRPRRAFVGARTRSVVEATYVEHWRQKVERIGTLNYPEAARGKIYGSLKMTVHVRADGSVEAVDIDQSSGHPELDEAARHIALMAAPYAAFPPDLRAETDILGITRTWSFTQGEQIRTR